MMGMLDDFMFRAAAGFSLLAIIIGPLGSVALWRRLAYFGDATAHASLLGVAVALYFSISPWIGTLGIAILIAIYLGNADERFRTPDGSLAVIAHGGLAIALLIMMALPARASRLETYLIGDLLALSKGELLLLAALIPLALIWLIRRWPALVYATINHEMAAARGINARAEARYYCLLLAMVVALGVQLAGTLLIGALIIMPAMIARGFSHSPHQMAWLASLIALGAGQLGLLLSYTLELPASPAIIAVLSIFYAALSALRGIRGI